MKLKAILAACFLCLGLGGCTTLGTNVNAKFRCDAPEGVCAPSMVIDDSALARIEETSSQDLLNPAGPFRMDDGIEAPVHSPALGAEALIAQAAPSYELAVVFPGYTDASGTVHARRTVRTEAALPGRGDAMETMAMRGPKLARAQGLLAAAESAPPFLAIAPSVFAAPDLASSTTEPAGAPAVAAAPSPAPRPRDPIADIEARVSEKLAAQQRTPRREAASFPATPE